MSILWDIAAALLSVYNESTGHTSVKTEELTTRLRSTSIFEGTVPGHQAEDLNENVDEDPKDRDVPMRPVTPLLPAQSHVRSAKRRIDDVDTSRDEPSASEHSDSEGDEDDEDNEDDDGDGDESGKQSEPRSTKRRKGQRPRSLNTDKLDPSTRALVKTARDLVTVCLLAEDPLCLKKDNPEVILRCAWNTALRESRDLTPDPDVKWKSYVSNKYISGSSTLPHLPFS